MRRSVSLDILKALLIFMIYKWLWPTHASVAEVTYNALPADVKKNLELKRMEDGSNDPDEKFKDMANHHYPQSLKKANKWLEDGKKFYETKKYSDASYCFGVATHYISDTFSAPHCVSKELSRDHHSYEKISDSYTPQVTYLKGDLDTLMKKGVEQGKLDWAEWIKTKDESIPHRGVDMGASVTYSTIKNILS
jgi:hypothetical protein